MGKLLKVELKGMFRQFILRALLLLISALGIILGMMNHAADNAVTDGMIGWCGFLCVMLSAYGGLVISREFTRNTIRNKIIAGHGRAQIFLSKFIAVAVMYLVCISLFVFAITTTEGILVHKISVQGKTMVQLYATCFACAALTTAISIMIRTDIGGLVPLLVLYMALVFSGLGYEFIDKDIMDWINLFLPGGVLMNPETHKLLLSSGCAVAETIVFCVGGYLSFRKADLN